MPTTTSNPNCGLSLAREGYGASAATLAFLAQPKALFIGGAWVDCASEQMLETVDPASELVIGQVARADARDVDRAVKAARHALENGPWPTLTPADRQNLMLNLAGLVATHRQTLAELETLDNGKPLHESFGSVDDTVAYLRYMAGWATKLDGRAPTASAPGRPFTYTRREPVGVVGAIIPWNFPLSMAAWKLAPALACGCTLVLKPAEQTPLTALFLAGLVAEAGFPDGVFNLVTGLGNEAGAALAAHPGVDKIAFTGSTRVGRALAAAAGANLTRVTLELGGKSPMIVLADCDPAKAAAGAAGAIFYNQGQICCAGSRLYVHRKIYDTVVADLAARADAIKLSPGFAPNCQMGPLISEAQRKVVTGYIAKGLEDRAVLVAGGETEFDRGYFVRPTVFADTTNDMRLVREEIFGPVLTVAPFSNVDEAVRLANDTAYGLGASLWSNDLAQVLELVPRLRAGNVWVNTHNLVDPSLPFGGVKASGFGRELGVEQLDAYLETKSVWMAQ